MARGKRIACSLYGNIYKSGQWGTDSDKRWRYARCNRKKVVVFNYHEHSSYKNIMKADDWKQVITDLVIWIIIFTEKKT